MEIKITIEGDVSGVRTAEVLRAIAHALIAEGWDVFAEKDFDTILDCTQNPSVGRAHVQMDTE